MDHVIHRWEWGQGCPFRDRFFPRNGNSLEISFCCSPSCCAHDMPAIIALWFPTMKLHQNQFFMYFELWRKYRSWNGPLYLTDHMINVYTALQWRHMDTKASQIIGNSIVCSTGDRWIPLTKGQLHGKYFHFMTIMLLNAGGMRSYHGQVDIFFLIYLVILRKAIRILQNQESWAGSKCQHDAGNSGLVEFLKHTNLSDTSPRKHGYPMAISGNLRQSGLCSCLGLYHSSMPYIGKQLLEYINHGLSRCLSCL